MSDKLNQILRQLEQEKQRAEGELKKKEGELKHKQDEVTKKQAEIDKLEGEARVIQSAVTQAALKLETVVSKIAETHHQNEQENKK